MLLEQLCRSRWDSWQVLRPTDQLLHSAAHLFLDAEVRERVRDLVDLDGLFVHFGAREGFWSALVPRAAALGLTEPLALACHFCVRWLGTPVPADVLESLAVVLRRLRPVLPLFEQVLLPTEPDDAPSWRQRAAAAALAVRHHRQRMPLRLLMPHAWHKLRVHALGPDTRAAEPRDG